MTPRLTDRASTSEAALRSWRLAAPPGPLRRKRASSSDRPTSKPSRHPSRRQSARRIIEQRVYCDLLRQQLLAHAKIDDDLQRRTTRLDPESQGIEQGTVGRRLQRALAREEQPEQFLGDIRA